MEGGDEQDQEQELVPSSVASSLVAGAVMGENVHRMCTLQRGMVLRFVCGTGLFHTRARSPESVCIVLGSRGT